MISSAGISITRLKYVESKRDETGRIGLYWRFAKALQWNLIRCGKLSAIFISSRNLAKCERRSRHEESKRWKSYSGSCRRNCLAMTLADAVNTAMSKMIIKLLFVKPFSSTSLYASKDMRDAVINYNNGRNLVRTQKSIPLHSFNFWKEGSCSRASFAQSSKDEEQSYKRRLPVF